MNEFFKRGHLSNGFNGDTYWEPFELRPNEYDALVAEARGIRQYLDMATMMTQLGVNAVGA
jgi:hypothetical protein